MSSIDPSFWQAVPFIGLVVKKEHTQQPIATRLLEAAIIGGVVMYGTVQVLGEKITSLEVRIQTLQEQQLRTQSTIERRTERLETFHFNGK